MRRFNFRYLPELNVKGWCDGNLVTFDQNDADTLQTLDYMSNNLDEYVADLGMERLVETVLHMWQIKENKKTVKKLISEESDGLSRDIYDNWNIT